MGKISSSVKKNRSKNSSQARIKKRSKSRTRRNYKLKKLRRRDDSVSYSSDSDDSRSSVSVSSSSFDDDYRRKRSRSRTRKDVKVSKKSARRRSSNCASIEDSSRVKKRKGSKKNDDFQVSKKSREKKNKKTKRDVSFSSTSSGSWSCSTCRGGSSSSDEREVKKNRGRSERKKRDRRRLEKVKIESKRRRSRTRSRSCSSRSRCSDYRSEDKLIGVTNSRRLRSSEIGRYLEDTYGSLLFWRNRSSPLQELRDSEQTILLEESGVGIKSEGEIIQQGSGIDSGSEFVSNELQRGLPIAQVEEDAKKGVDAKGRWTRTRVAKASLLICPFWFLAQLTFNLSLKYTTVTSNTILSSASSLFTFLVSLAFLGEKFTWVKLISVLLCMAGTVIVSIGDSETSSHLSATASNPLLGDIFALVSAGLYAVYITLIRKKLIDDDGKSGHASMAQFLGYLGLFNLVIFLPVALILNFTKLEPFYRLTLKQFGLIVGKGLLDNVLSDYLWAKAVLLTTTTVATAGLTIQVPLAAVVDSLTGNAPNLLDYLGAVAVMIGFAGINIPSDAF